MNKYKILIVDDQESILETFSIFFESLDFKVDMANSFKEAIALITVNKYHTIVTDLRLGDKTGLDILRRVNELELNTPVILITAYASKETALKASKLGIYDYLTKPVDLDKLSVVVDRAIEKHLLTKQLNKLKRREFPYLVGNSATFSKIIDIAKRVAKTDINVLITGESGTGKELIARLIHENSLRNEKPFLPLNCGAIPENLIESELFGYTKGSFTGANTDRDGIFVTAKDGTVFLDEIGELPLIMQPKLLRVLQEQKIKKLGAHFETDINTRIISATNKNLKEEIDNKTFREDLYYRLNVINIELPPLRKRREDIPELVEFFIKNYNKKNNQNIEGVTSNLMNFFLDYSFPGNIRELKNLIERVSTLEEGNILTTKYLPKNIDDRKIIEISKDKDQNFQNDWEFPVELDNILEDLEKRYILKALEKSNGVKKNAAKLLNISFRSFRYRIKKHNLDD